MFRTSFSLSLLLLLGCQSTSSSNPPTSPLTPKEELFLARQMLPEIQRDHPALQKGSTQLKITQLGQKIIAASSLEGNPYNFSFVVVDVASINAFSLPAGFIFITQPLLEFVKNEDELAGIIAHEIAHVLLQHTSKNFVELENNKKRSWRYGMAGALIGAGVGSGISSSVCPGNSSCSAFLTGSTLGIGLQAGLLTEKYLFLKQSQQKELDADQLGFALTKKAGFNPQEVGFFFRRIEDIRSSQDKKQKSFWAQLVDRTSSHPTTEERLQQINH